MFSESEYRASSGIPTLLILLIIAIASFGGLIYGAQSANVMILVAGSIVFALTCVAFGGLFVIQPGDAKVLVLFGAYKGSIKTPGFYFANPFLSKRTISLLIRNFETQNLKVNDLHSNPIEISAIVVWTVFSPAAALF